MQALKGELKRAAGAGQQGEQPNKIREAERAEWRSTRGPEQAQT